MAGIGLAAERDQDVVIGFKLDFEMKISGDEALDRRRGRGGRHYYSSGDFFRRGEVFFHERGRQRQHVGDVVEAVAGIVDGKIGGGIKRDREEIADSGGVFVAIQAMEGSWLREDRDRERE